MKKLTILICGLILGIPAFSQEIEMTETEKLAQRTEALENTVKTLSHLKVSGYIQTQFQWGQQDAAMKVGVGNENMKESFSRMGIRRGRIKFAYEQGIASGVFQLDITDKSKNAVNFKDAYINIKDPWVGTSAFRAGIFDRPFGYEISFSSSRRESPERSTVFQTLFPDERDLGAMLILQPAKTSPWNGLKLQAGLFAGNGIQPETDNHRDFIGQLIYTKLLNANTSMGVGVSYYNGGIFQGTNNIYTMKDGAFTLDDNADNLGKFAKREYFGADAQFTLISSAGLTQLRGEYLFGQQPGTSSKSNSPSANARPTGDTYIRDFNGGYVMLVQDLGTLPFSVLGKYDWYNPNKDVSGDEIGANAKTSAADISVNTIGFGGIWRINTNLRATAYYEINSNEITTKLAGFDKDRKDNLFTFRIQYKF